MPGALAHCPCLRSEISRRAWSRSSDLPTASAEGLTKQKKSKKNATDFAKELDDLDAERQEDEADALDREIGEDPFDAAGGADDGDDDEGAEAWVKEGRVATYPEVSPCALSWKAEGTGANC